MRVYDLIHNKRDGKELSQKEIEYLIKGYCEGTIPDYQMSAFLMAVYFRGMTKKETLYMTNAAAHSGEMIDLSAIDGIKVDKHSTGGVGDKTTLIVAPIVASLGVKVAKMSGRGLGHTGGTIDKLESIPGFQTTVSEERFFEIVNDIGVSVIGQTANIAPADKKLYALRDVTATVDSIPLIAVSIMSKKLAAGSDCIILDVKCGSGAFMKDLDSSTELAKEMVEIGENAGRKTIAIITNMDIPLGRMVGNSLEVKEAILTLQGKGEAEFEKLCIELAANMLQLGGKGDYNTCYEMARESIYSGKALETLAKMVKAQGGDATYIHDISKFKKAGVIKEIKADKAGYICKMNAEEIGIVSSMLGAGRETKDSIIDHSAGIELVKKTGDYVDIGDIIAYLHTNIEDVVIKADKKYLEAITIENTKPEQEDIILAKVVKE